MFEGPDKRKKKSGIPTAFGITNAVLGVAGKVLGGVAKAGYNALADANNKQHRELAMAEIEPIMFLGGVRPTPGHPLPPLRTAPLNPDELQRFTKACNGLISRGIPLEPYVQRFAARFYIRLNH